MSDRNLKMAATSEVKNKLRLMNVLISFVIFLLLFVILRYLEGPVSKFLEFLPETNMIVIVVLVTILAGLGLYFSRKLSSQIVQRIEDYSNKLDTILNITREIRDELYGDILLEKIMESSLQITKSDAGSVLLVDGDKLVFKVVKGSKAQDLLGKAIPKDKGVGGWVLEQGKPALVNNVKGDSRYNPDMDAVTGYSTNSMLCVPLTTKSHPVGVIEILNKRQGFFDEQDVDIISYLADHAAISIERAQFYDDQRNYEIHLTDILLDTIDRFIPEKNGHSRRVSKYANVIARSIDMDDGKKRRLYFACLMHDIGFLKIPLDVSFKKEEYMLHPEIAFEMLSPINFYSDIAPFILHHHERFDGQGYPKNLKGDQIPLEARIISIAEAFDAMASPVSYRLTMSFEESIKEILRHKGTQFDPELADVFIDNIKSTLD